LSQEVEYFFRVLFQQTNKQTLAHRRTCLRDFSTNFPGNSKSENPALCESFMLKLLDPPLLVGIYFTTLERKNIYMIHGMRGYQKVAKSCKIFLFPKNTYVNIYICICVKAMRSVFTPNPHPPLPQLQHPWHQTLCRAEWVLLVRWHLPGLPLIHQPERLASSSSALFICLFVGIKPGKIYSASCWARREGILV